MNALPAVTLRLAREADARAMADMSRELIEAGLDWRYTPTRMAALIAERETSAVVACISTRVDGFAIMSFADEHAHLVLLCVQRAQQRRGIGRRLVEWLLRSAEVAGMASIRLELRADNAAAEAFYRRLGFAETQHVPGYYSDRIAARRMVLARRLPPADGCRGSARPDAG
jgi:ribosomal-protein-alanine N-acetyltransferase